MIGFGTMADDLCRCLRGGSRLGLGVAVTRWFVGAFAAGGLSAAPAHGARWGGLGGFPRTVQSVWGKCEIVTSVVLPMVD